MNGVCRAKTEHRDYGEDALAAEARRQFAASGHASDVNTAYRITDKPIDDLDTTTQQLTARLDGAVRGSILSLD